MILFSQKVSLFIYIRRLFHIYFIFPLLFLNSIEVRAQWLYEIAGSVTNGNKKIDAAVITLYKEGAQVQQLTTTSNGKFILRLDQEAEYELNVTKSGYIAKKFLFSTKGVPSDIAKTYEGGAKPEISIFELPKDPKVVAQVNSILEQPIAKFLYDPTEQDIVFDKEYSKSMLQELNRLNQLEKESKKKQEDETKNQQTVLSALAGKYDATIAKGDAAFAKKDYTTAKMAYQDALTVKKGESYPLGKIVEIEKLIAEGNKLNQVESDYKAAITKADLALSEKKYEQAKGMYRDALKIKPKQDYPSEKLQDIDKILADISNSKDLDAKYNAAIVKADKAFDIKSYEMSKTAYAEALGIKSSEKYPKSRLVEIDRLLNEMNAKNKAESGITEKYTIIIAKADKALNLKDYSIAKSSYMAALEIKPNEQYPTQKIAEIDHLIATESASNALNAKFLAIISKADKSFEAKDYTISKTFYKDALALKGNELYPKNRIIEIDKMLADAVNKNAVQELRLLNEKAANEKYLAAISKADADYASKEYASARTKYSDALSIKNTESYPKEQISKIDLIVVESNKENATKKQKYDEALSKADANLLKKDYQNALISFKEAQAIRPTEPYPTAKIAEINATFDALARSKENDNRYKLIIEKADQLFVKKEYKVAKGSYLDALLIKPTEKYPKDKVAAINLLLNNKTTTIAIPEKRSMDDFRNELAKKYPQGITEESAMEGNIKVIRRILVKGVEAHLYLKKITSFGAVYYFKDEISITEADYIKETEVKSK